MSEEEKVHPESIEKNRRIRDAEIETELETSLEYRAQIIKYKSRVNRHLSESEPVRKSSDVSTLRKLYDEITIQIRCLESLKVDINSYGNLLLPFLYKCIPNDLVLRFNRQIAESEVTVTSLLSCIEKEIEAREKTVCLNNSKFTRNEEKRFENYHKNYVPTKKKIFSASTLNTIVEKKFATSVLKTTNLKTVIRQCQSGINHYMTNIKKAYVTHILWRHPKAKTTKESSIGDQQTKTICASKISGPSTRMAEILQNEGFELSDSGASSGRIDILIGNDYLRAVLTRRTHRLNNYLSNKESEENLSEEIRALWEVENLGICDSEKSESDKEVIERFEKNLKFVDNRYETGLLWNRNPGDLTDNFDLARRQFNKVRRELKNDTFVKELLMEVIKYQKEHNVIQECGENKKEYFMSFRAVVRKDKLSTQVRMVFNCSSCAKGNLSLNDCLDQGPKLNPSVFDIIL
ncbi:reverse transcriptase [Caerostris extrusa]|uniref:Reverse transcriptase n=1 Tax=Caerostris extrusa TaxID=172846 RepID=A0AAV4RYR5_CAEEX|nr:reverse transcriptase [Caerostris extrusa]